MNYQKKLKKVKAEARAIDLAVKNYKLRTAMTDAIRLILDGQELVAVIRLDMAIKEDIKA